MVRSSIESRRELGWWIVRYRAGQVAIEAGGISNRWIVTAWWKGYPIGRVPGMHLSARHGFAVGCSWLATDPWAAMRRRGFETHEVAIPAVVGRTILDSRRHSSPAALRDLCRAFGVAAPDPVRVGDLGASPALVRYNDGSTPEERGRALQRYLAASRLSGYRRLAVVQAARLAGLPPPSPGENLDLAMVHTRRCRLLEPAPGGWTLVATIAMTMLTSSGDVPFADRWLEIAEVAALLKVSPADVATWIAGSLLPHVRLPLASGGSTVRILPKQLAQFAKSMERMAQCQDAVPNGSGSGSSGAKAAPTSISNGTTQRASTTDGGQRAPTTPPRLRLPGRGSCSNSAAPTYRKYGR